MSLNPFIEFAQNPIHALALLGYTLLLLSLTILSVFGAG